MECQHRRLTTKPLPTAFWVSLVLVFVVPVDLRWSVIFGWVWLGDFSSDACRIRLCLRRWQFGGAPDVRALANLELSSAPPLLMSRMKMVQLSKWQLVPPIPCGIAALSSFIYRQFLLRLRSSLASWPTLHSSATNWLIGGCACLWRETRLSYTNSRLDTWDHVVMDWDHVVMDAQTRE